MFRTTAFALIAALSLAGCAADGSGFGGGTSDQPLTPAQQQLREQSNRYNTTLATGAVVGALVGAGVGALVSRDRSKGALYGAAIGGAVGTGAGYYVATQNERYANREQEINSRITAARQENETYRQSLVTIQQVVAEDRQKIAALNQRYRQGQVNQAQMRSEVSAIEEDRNRIQRTQEAIGATRQRVEADIEAYRRQGVSTTALERERQQLVQNEQRTARELDSLNQALRSAPLA